MAITKELYNADQINDNAEKVDIFKRSIIKDAETIAEKAVESAKIFREKYTADARTDFVIDAQHKISAGVKEIVNEFRAAISKKSFESRSDMLKKRAELTNNFFNEIKDKLKKFASTPEYKSFLSECIIEIAKEYPFYSGVTVFVSEGDVQKFSEGSLSGVVIKSDKNIKIGGVSVYYPKENFFADKTFDRELEFRQKEFSRNPELEF